MSCVFGMQQYVQCMRHGLPLYACNSTVIGVAYAINPASMHENINDPLGRHWSHDQGLAIELLQQFTQFINAHIYQLDCSYSLVCIPFIFYLCES